MVRTKRPKQLSTQTIVSEQNDITSTENTKMASADVSKPIGESNNDNDNRNNNNNNHSNEDDTDTGNNKDNSRSHLDHKDCEDPQAETTTNPLIPSPSPPASSRTMTIPAGLTQNDIDFKVAKIQCMSMEATKDEILCMLEDCYFNEDEVILRLITQSDYLYSIRSRSSAIATIIPLFLSANNATTNTLLQVSGALPLTQPMTNFSGKLQNTLTLPADHPQQQQQQQQQQQIRQDNAIPSLPQSQITQTQQNQLDSAPTQPTSSMYKLEGNAFPYYRPLQPLPIAPLLALPTTPDITLPAPLPVKPPRRTNKGMKYKKRIKNPPPIPLPNESSDTGNQHLEDASVPSTPIPTSASLPPQKVQEEEHTKSAKRQIRAVGRLALDDALKQIKDNPTHQQQAYEGWSEARIRAYRMIDTNPNSYYYRFNAPGEEQRKGPWTAEEKQLFLRRLAEMGANSQWGVFSMSVPGRVGYQCSNFYRLLIETGEIYDQNYILDEKGKAHYLFEKKTDNGQVEKIVRTHCKHKSIKARQWPTDNNKENGSSKSAKEDENDKATKTTAKRKSKKKHSNKDGDGDDLDDDDDDSDYTGRPKSYKSTKKGTRRYTKRSSRT